MNLKQVSKWAIRFCFAFMILVLISKTFDVTDLTMYLLGVSIGFIVFLYNLIEGVRHGKKRNQK